MMQRMDLYGPCQERQALHLWADVVGPHVAHNTAAVVVRNGVLFVRTSSSAWMNELAIGFRHQYLERLNVRLGKNVLSDIRFLPPPLPRPQVSPEKSGSIILKPLPLSSQQEKLVETIVAVIEKPEVQLRIRRLMRMSMQLHQIRLQAGWQPCSTCGLLTQGEVCLTCRHRRTAERLGEIHALMLRVPWVSALEVKAQFPETILSEYEAQKRALLHRLHKKLTDWEKTARDRETFPESLLGFVLRYCMLRSGKPPHQLRKEHIHRALGSRLATRYPNH